jgi:hypothetical protein
MKKIALGLVALVLMLSSGAGASARRDCCDGTSCCNGTACCKKARK